MLGVLLDLLVSIQFQIWYKYIKITALFCMCSSIQKQYNERAFPLKFVETLFPMVRDVLEKVSIYCQSTMYIEMYY